MRAPVDRAIGMLDAGAGTARIKSEDLVSARRECANERVEVAMHVVTHILIGTKAMGLVRSLQDGGREGVATAPI